MSKDRNLKDNSTKKSKSKSMFHKKTGYRESGPTASDSFAIFLSAIGNQASSQFFGKDLMQAKLQVNQPGDTYEQQADHIAGQIVQNQGKAPVASISAVNHIPASTFTGNAISNSATSRIKNLSGKGNSLSQQSRNFFEPRFGVDLGNVRVHNDSNANQLAGSLNARAFTHGTDIVFNKGEYTPGTQDGNKLLAHELTHVLQQGGGVQREVLQKEEVPGMTTGVIPSELAATYRNYQDMQSVPYIAQNYINFLDYLRKMSDNAPPAALTAQQLINLKTQARLFLGEVRDFNNTVHDNISDTISNVRDLLVLENTALNSIIFTRLISELFEAIGGLGELPALKSYAAGITVFAECLKIAWDVYTVYTDNVDANTFTLTFNEIASRFREKGNEAYLEINRIDDKLNTNYLLLTYLASQDFTSVQASQLNFINREFEIQVWKQTLGLKWGHTRYPLEFTEDPAVVAEYRRKEAADCTRWYEIEPTTEWQLFRGNVSGYRITEHWLGNNSYALMHVEADKVVSERLFSKLKISKEEVFKHWGLKEYTLVMPSYRPFM